MNVLSRAVCATLIAVTLIVTGCGENFRQVARPEPVPGGNPAGTETEVVLNQCPSGLTCIDESGVPTGSVVTAINVGGDSYSGNKPLQNEVGSVAGPVAGSISSPIAFDGDRTSVFTANTSTDSVTRLTLATSTQGFGATTTTITLPTGAAPTGISFQYFGVPYTQDFVVNSGATAVCSAGGSLGVISKATATLTATVCLGAGADPVAAWIYKDLKKVFVLDFSQSKVYVVDVNSLDPGTPKLTNTILLPGGSGPFKVAQSNSGLFIYVLNAIGTISIIDGEAESVVGLPVSTSVTTASPPVDMTQDLNFNDTSANTQINHVWILHADGTVSVFDGTGPGSLSWITSLSTITPAQAAAGAFPTNLVLQRLNASATGAPWAYVGVGNTDQVVAIDSSKLAFGAVTTNATTPITVGIKRTIQTTQAGVLVTLETTTPTVTSVGISRQGSSSQLSKAYATTVTSTTYNYFDGAGNFLSSATYPNLYNAITIVAADNINGGAAALNHQVNDVIRTLPAPQVVFKCEPGNSATGAYDLQKNCPAMIPVLALGRN